MYKLSYYTEENQDKVFTFMQQNPFVILTGFGKEYPVATHIPLDIKKNDEGTLIFTGHMMKATDHHKAFVENPNVLVIFNGSHTYISASWYTEPHIASTWNYMTVHAKGKISFMDEEGTYQVIKNVTAKYEAESENPSLVEQMSPEYIKKNIKAIIGFEIVVEEIDNVFKLSQNRDKESKQRIIEQLKKRGDGNSLAIAMEMEKKQKMYFTS